MKAPMIETQRIPLSPEEHEKLGTLVRAAEQAKTEATKYIDELGLRYSIYAGSTDCSVGFENGVAIISEPRRVMRAS